MERSQQRGLGRVRGGTSRPWASLAHFTSSFGETVSGMPCVLGVRWLRLGQESVSQWEMCLAGESRCHFGRAALPRFPLLSLGGAHLGFQFTSSIRVRREL